MGHPMVALLGSTALASRVSVCVRQPLSATPEAASAAWLDYTWSSGGGLPAFVLPIDREAWRRGEAPTKRLVLPLALEEALGPAAAGDQLTTRRYRVTDDGILKSELVGGTHSACVSFEVDGPGSCELVWSCEYDVRARQPFWKWFTEYSIGRAASSLAAHLREPSLPYWFAPLDVFGPIDEAAPPASELPLLLVLPGLDGSGVTAWAQYAELAQSYVVRALAIPPNDRSSFEALVEQIRLAVEQGAEGGREVYLLGESMGAGVALEVGRRLSLSASPMGSYLSGLVLISPATSWDRTWLGAARAKLMTLPEPVLSLIVALTSYQLLDPQQFVTTARRIATGERSPLLASEERTAYAWRVVRELPTRLASPAATVRHRISRWVEPTLAAGTAEALAGISIPMLLVAGTADRRVPAVDEVRRIAREAPPSCACTVHLVEGAGHAGVTDDRLDLRAVMNGWRGSCKAQPPGV